MSAKVGVSHAAAFTLYASTCVFAGASRADVPKVCTVIPVETAIRQVGREHRLLISIKNTSPTLIELHEFYFGANILHLRAVEKPGQQDLRQVVPLLAPGVEPAKIGPGKTLSREIPLDVSFPGLQASLKKTDVEVSWEVDVSPNNGCFSERVAASVILKKMP